MNRSRLLLAGRASLAVSSGARWPHSTTGPLRRARALQLDAGGLPGGVYSVPASDTSGVATRRIALLC